MFKSRHRESGETPPETSTPSSNDEAMLPGEMDPSLPADDPRIDAARHIIKDHVIAAMGVSLVPVPLVDLLALSVLQLRMVRKLARLYDLPFHRSLVKGLVAALLGGLLPTSAAMSAASLAKVVPGAGTTVGVISVSALGGAATWAVGQTFLRHFATGGNLLNFDPETMQDYLRARFQEGKRVASRLRRD